MNRGTAVGLSSLQRRNNTDSSQENSLIHVLNICKDNYCRLKADMIIICSHRNVLNSIVFIKLEGNNDWSYGSLSRITAS